MATYALTSNPNRHYYATRAQPILGIVLHVTAGLEDFTPPDSGAEATVKYGQSNTRPASWHGIVDSDSIINCLPDGYTAFHAIGYNSPTLGLEIANRDAKWAGKPDRWVEATMRNAAAWCRPRVQRYGLPVRLCTRAQVDAAVKAGRPFGFTYHRYLDPTRRIDPGFDFPWARFAAYVNDGAAAAVAAPTRARGPFPLPEGHWFGVDDGTDQSHSGVRAGDEVGVQQVQAEVDATPDGEYGPATETAVREWQKAHGPPVTGRVDAETWAAMISGGEPATAGKTTAPAKAAAPAKTSAPALRAKGPFPLPKGHWYGPESADPRNHSGYHQRDREGVRQIQAEVGATPDGAYGPDTTARVRLWQRKHGLTIDGLVGATSWAKMLEV